MTVDPPPQAAPVVPGYVLEELLGRGGSGQVWRARPRSGGDPVAVKVLVRGDPARQVREAALLGELDHPHLVRVHRVVRREVRTGPAEVSLVLDLLEGGSLAGLLARRGRLRPGEVVTAIAPVAAALAHAHEHGIVHGDLSPGNVVFTAEGRPVLTDLGTARLLGETGRTEVTPGYVDPVVARGGAPGPASDVFGVAAAAFHALTGIAPWNAGDPGGALEVAAGGHLPDLALLAPDAPAELVRVIGRGLAPEPHLRGSAAAFALDLRHACRPEPVRLPVPHRPDEVLGETGQGPRTELTHQVRGPRARAAHAAPAEVGRLARVRAAVAERRAAGLPWGALAAGRPARRWVVSGAALVALGAALAGAAWVGSQWGTGGTTDPVPAAEAEPAPAEPVPSAGPPDAGPPVAQPPVAGPPVAQPPVAEPPAVEPPAVEPPPPGDPAPDDLAGWAAVLQQLYGQRARAFSTSDGALLGAVYAPGSPLLQRDAEQVTRLASAGETVTGFDPAVLRVTSVRPGGDETVLTLVDEVPAHRIGPAGAPDGAGREVAARGPAEVVMTLQRTGDGWRIVDAAKAG